MGHESLVYGCIVGERWKVTDMRRLQRLNRAEITTLPETDEWPFLTRSMFSVPGDEPVEGSYRSQLIHFGASFKYIEWYWDEWLVKFESLLVRLFWRDVYLHLRTELVGDYNYKYKAMDYTESFYNCEPPRPASSWTLTGGPRRFLETGPEFEDMSNLIWLYDDGIWSLKPNEVDQNESDS